MDSFLEKDLFVSPATPAPNSDWRARVPTVSQLTRRLRGHLESTFFDVWVRGEISTLRKPASGHAYLVLKDTGAQLKTCFFRQALSKLKFQLEEGMEVLIHGKITVYEARGEYQMVADAVEPVGTGALQLAFEQLKKKLEAEGLFSPGKKRPLPTLPKRIGVVTSSTGAAIQDILKVLKRRFPDREILIFATSVQGEKAAGEIVQALERLESWNRVYPDRAVEVAIVGRGGGSLEDLWPFNEETVARALAACPVPTISAVGHETDFTIADFVADVRAPTPSAAAEVVLPQKQDLVYQVGMLNRRLILGFTRSLEQKKLHVGHLSRRLISPSQRIASLRERFLLLRKRLQTSMEMQVKHRRHQLAGASGKLQALSPLQVLARGYSITYTDNKPVHSASELSQGVRLTTQLADGKVYSEVLSVECNRS